MAQGGPITYDDVSLVDGENYLVDIQATQAFNYPTGAYVDSVTNTWYDGTTNLGGNTTNGVFMLVNDSTSPYGAGWSIGGLQQITLGTGTPNYTLMITDGNLQPEEFTSSNNVNFTGNAADSSTLTYSSSSHTYTRAYPDGSTVIFNSSGQETSSTDRNGNTYNYAYVTSGAGDGCILSSPTR